MSILALLAELINRGDKYDSVEHGHTEQSNKTDRCRKVEIHVPNPERSDASYKSEGNIAADQVGIIERLFRAGELSPPEAKTSGIVTHPEIGIDDNAIQTIIAARQQRLISPAQCVHLFVENNISIGAQPWTRERMRVRIPNEPERFTRKEKRPKPCHNLARSSLTALGASCRSKSRRTTC